MPDLVEVTLDRQRGPLGKAADVFDMGMLMWQLASGRAVREGFNVEDMRESTAVSNGKVCLQDGAMGREGQGAAWWCIGRGGAGVSGVKLGQY